MKDSLEKFSLNKKKTFFLKFRIEDLRRFIKTRFKVP